MKKSSLYSLAALLAGACLPAGTLMSNISAQDVTADYCTPANSETYTPDRFIEEFCGTRISRVLPDGSETFEFIWYTSVTEENAPVLAKSKAIFDAMTPEEQTIIQNAGLAFGADYITLAQNAQVLLDRQAAQTPAPEETQVPASEASSEQTEESVSEAESSEEKNSEESSSAESKEESSQKPADSKDDSSASSAESSKPEQDPSVPTESTESVSGTDTSAPDSGAETITPVPSVPSVPVQEKPSGEPEQNPGTPVESPEASKSEEEPAPVQKPVYVYSEGSLNLLPAHRPKGLSVIEYAPVEDEYASQAAALIAQAAGWPAHVTIPVSYVYENGDLRIESKQYWRVSVGDLMILFDYSVDANGVIHVQIYSDGSCSYDMTNGLTFPISGSAVLTPQYEQDQRETAEIETGEAAAVPAGELVALNVFDQQAEDGKVRAADLSDQVSQESKVSMLANPIRLTLDTTGNDFVAKYCTRNGAVIRGVNESNYQQILSGMQAWNSMSNSQRRSVNDYLIENGSTRFQTLYQQANQYRLGMPIKQGSGGVGSAASVNTASHTMLFIPAAGFTLSASALALLASKKRKLK